MMFRHSKSRTEQYQGGTTPLIYLVSSVQRVQELGLEFVFTDGHPIKAFTRFFADVSYLEKVDWSVMRAKIWRDTNDHPDRSRRRMAEFLVYDSFPWETVEFLAVRNVRWKERLDKFLKEQWPHRVKPVRVEPGWYF
jgi:hypothetical protein